MVSTFFISFFALILCILAVKFVPKSIGLMLVESELLLSFKLSGATYTLVKVDLIVDLDIVAFHLILQCPSLLQSLYVTISPSTPVTKIECVSFLYLIISPAFKVDNDVVVLQFLGLLPNASYPNLNANPIH